MEHDLTVKSIENFEEFRSMIVNAVNVSPAFFQTPVRKCCSWTWAIQARFLELGILWWTKSPGQHEMLTSYDSVLMAIRQALGHYEAGGGRDQGRAA